MECPGTPCSLINGGFWGGFRPLLFFQTFQELTKCLEKEILILKPVSIPITYKVFMLNMPKNAFSGGFQTSSARRGGSNDRICHKRGYFPNSYSQPQKIPPGLVCYWQIFFLSAPPILMLLFLLMLQKHFILKTVCFKIKWKYVLF